MGVLLTNLHAVYYTGGVYNMNITYSRMTKKNELQISQGKRVSLWRKGQKICKAQGQGAIFTVV